MSSLSEAGHLVLLLAGAFLLFKKVAEMDRYHNLRVFVLVTILSFFVIVFFLAYGLTMGDPGAYDCGVGDSF